MRKAADYTKENAPFMPIKSAANVTGLSEFYLRTGCIQGTIPHIRCGNKILINVPKLIEQLDKMSLQSLSDHSNAE